MRHSRSIILVLLLLLPLFSWTAIGGGGGLRCHAGSFCPMQARTGQRCSMMASQPMCAVSSQAELALPAPLVPVVPMPHRVTGIPALSVLAAALPGSEARLTAGWPLGVFHPPQA